jgi:micrococcal nuclease
MTRRPVTIGLVLVGAISIVVAVLQTGGKDRIARAQPPPTEVEVAALVDGDTFDVRVGDVITRVRLAYVRTPPRPRPDQRPACLAADASARLASIIPVGTHLTLRYDKDRLGHPSAEARTTDGRLVNAEIVRAGYAHLVAADSDAPIPAAVGDAVTDATEEAAVNQRGMHSASVACTVPGQVKAVTDAVAAIPAAALPTATALDLSASANRATVARMAAEELTSAFAQNRQETIWLALSSDERVRLLTQVQEAGDHAAQLETALREATNTSVNQAVTLAASQREAARVAKVLADLRKAEADRAARAAARAAAARKARLDALEEARSRAAAARDQQARERRDRERRANERSDSSDDSNSRDSDSGSDRGSESDRSSSSRGD